MHMASIKEGILGATGIVGSGPVISIAGLALKMDKKPNVIVSFFGDGATNEGSVHEAINMRRWGISRLFLLFKTTSSPSRPPKRPPKGWTNIHQAEAMASMGTPVTQ
jgi:hypothetical protein